MNSKVSKSRTITDSKKFAPKPVEAPGETNVAEVEADAPVVIDGQFVPASDGESTGPTAVQGRNEAKREEKNGVIRPSAGTFCAKVWEALDALHKDGKEISIEAVREIAGQKMADATVRTQRQRWHTFNALPKTRAKSTAISPSSPDETNS